MGNISEILESDEVRKEVTSLIQDMLDETPSNELVTAAIQHYSAPVMDGITWGFGDTVVREGFMSTVALILLGCDWPTYGDTSSPEGQVKYADFDERILAAARLFKCRQD